MSDLTAGIGTVTMASDATVSGSGLALALGQQWRTAFTLPTITATDAAIDAAPGMSSGDKATAKADAKQKQVDAFNDNMGPWLVGMATAILTHITNNLQLRTKIQAGIDSELQRLPAALVDSEPTRSPSTTKYLTVEFVP
jgi:hypothetical protein